MGYIATPGKFELFCKYLIQQSDQKLRQEYIFGHTTSPLDMNCLRNSAKLIQAAKLIILKNFLVSPPLIPCFTCRHNIFSALNVVPLRDIQLV